MTRIAVFASGGGSNLAAILNHLESLGTRRGGDVALVLSNRTTAGALDRARQRGIEAVVPAAAESLTELLADHAIDLVVLAGYLRLVPAELVHRYAGRIINIHPALLPAFGGSGMYGLRVHQAVLDSGATVTGATVHFVDEEFDRGTIIAQWPVPVLAGDDATKLAARVLRVEHLLYPRVVNAVAANRITVGSCHSPRGPIAADAAFTLHNLDDTHLAQEIENSLGC